MRLLRGLTGVAALLGISPADAVTFFKLQHRTSEDPPAEEAAAKEGEEAPAEEQAAEGEAAAENATAAGENATTAEEPAEAAAADPAALEEDLEKALYHASDWRREWHHGDYPTWKETVRNAEDVMAMEDYQSDGKPSVARR
eukprot:TRINITY_DN93069_c0_g1_i1.p1 TRINITY_DN93069_c0_g1~~TRINITY_DN93069_c0_g1_i1.p1  ORF type:complete len:142 (-),score=52.98 TRINITY_DN93069_c0_g1_i1:47-472(-)